MDFILWLIAVVLVIWGIFRIIHGDVIWGVVLIVIGLLVGPGGVSIFGADLAHAQSPDPPVDPAGPIDPGNTLASLRLSATLVQALVGTFIPVLVGLVTKLADRWKGLAMIVLNAAAALVVTSTVSDGTAVISQQSLYLLLPGVLGSVAAYYGIWRPNGVTSSVYRPAGVDAPVAGKLARVGRS